MVASTSSVVKTTLGKYNQQGSIFIMTARYSGWLRPYFRLQLSLLFYLVFSLGLTACQGNHAERDEKLQRLASWEDMRFAPEDSLRDMILDSDARVRLAAARSAGLIGRDEAVTPLLKILTDPSLAIRAEACFSLGLLGSEPAVQALLQMSTDAHPSVRLAALAGLAQVPGGGPALLAATKAEDPKVMAAAWDGLRNHIGEMDSTQVLDAIQLGLAQAPISVTWRVLRCAEQLPDSTLVPSIAPLANSIRPMIRIHAYRALGNQKGPLALGAVLNSESSCKVFRGRDQTRVGIALCRALGKLGPQALVSPAGQEPSAEALAITRILIDASNAEDPHLSRTALDAMTSCVQGLPLPEQAAQRESLLPVWRIRMVRSAAGLLASDHLGVRRAAIEAWASLRGAGCSHQLMQLLSEASNSGDKATILTALGRVHPDPLLILLPVARADRKLPQPGDKPTAPLAPLVRTAALEAMDQVLFSRPEALPAGMDSISSRRIIGGILRRASQDQDFVVSTTAAGLLAHYPGSQTAIALAALWHQATGPGRFEIQRGVIKGLLGMKSLPGDSLTTKTLDLCASVLQSGFDSTDIRIRMEARSAAIKTGMVAKDLVPSKASLRATLPAAEHDPAQPPVALPFKAPKIRCTTPRGTFTIALDGHLAPNTCTVFLDLIAKGFYDDMTFHRVVPDFVIQGGDPRGDGWGGPGYTIRSEWSATPFKRGVVGIAHDGKDTGGSQFFVTLSEQPHLNARYTVFGKVTAGMATVDMIEVGDHFKLSVIP